VAVRSHRPQLFAIRPVYQHLEIVLLLHSAWLLHLETTLPLLLPATRLHQPRQHPLPLAGLL
jgi:hypothetical protein